MREYQPPPEPTESDLRWRASWRRYGAEVDRLLSDTGALAEFGAHCRSLGASAGLATESPEPAVMVGRGNGEAA